MGRFYEREPSARCIPSPTASRDPSIRTAIQAAPEACEEVWWGKRLAAVGVTLARVDQALLGELLADAWEQKAPKRLLDGR